MNHHAADFRRPLIAFSAALLFSIVGCEQRYVGGPTAIVRGAPPEHGMLGVTFSDPPNALILRAVLTDGPAFHAGIQSGDEILAIAEQEVQLVNDVHTILRSTQPGDQIVVRIRRSDEEKDFNVRLCDFALLIALRGAQSSEEDPDQQADVGEDEVQMDSPRSPS